MSLDPTIPLAAQAPQPQISLGSIIGQAMQLKQLQQQMQTQNALKAAISRPDAVDPKTGQFTGNTLAQVMQIDPALGAKLTTDKADVEEKAAQTAHAQSDTQVAQRKMYREELNGALGEYDAALKSGNVAPEIAERNLRQNLSDQVDELSISQSEKDRLKKLAMETPIAQLRAYAMTPDQAEKEQELTEERTPAVMDGKPVTVDKAGNVYDPNTGQKLQVTAPIKREATEFDPARAEAAADNAKPSLENDPVTGKQYWAFPPTNDRPARYETLGGQPYQPQGAARIQSGQVRGGIAGAIQAAQAENQAKGLGPLTADQIEQISSDYTRKTRAAAAFGVGKQGDQVRFLNVAMDHLGTLKDAALALKNGDIPSFNALAKKVAQESGSPVPTNFDAIRQIVSQEVHKGVAGVGGSAEERDNLAKNVDRAASPEQLFGAIDSVDKLLAGQADGLRRQYEEATDLDNFDDMLSPSARLLLKDHPDTPRGAQSSASPSRSARRPTANEVEQFKSLPPSRKEEARKWALGQGVDMSGVQ